MEIKVRDLGSSEEKSVAEKNKKFLTRLQKKQKQLNKCL